MTEIVGIQFNNASRVYYFAPNGLKFNNGEYAIVETVRGMELGKVIIANRMVEDSDVSYELKQVIRKATPKDMAIAEKHEKMAPYAFDTFKKLVSELNLPMKPLYCEYTIDSSKVSFYYTADDRVDFRELLKRMTPLFKLRIELRQIGPREAARIIGGLGSCGRTICCASCLNTFDFVTMKMAKEQNMSLNTNKISGLCGKLMCCIAFEHELYTELRKEVPGIGEMVKTPTNKCCKVVGVDYIKKNVLVQENLEGTPTKYQACDVSRLKVEDPTKDNTIKVDVQEAPKIEEEVEVKTEGDKSKHKKVYHPFKQKQKENKKNKKK